jgi:hypothetical protein
MVSRRRRGRVAPLAVRHAAASALQRHFRYRRRVRFARRTNLARMRLASLQRRRALLRHTRHLPLFMRRFVMSRAPFQRVRFVRAPNRPVREFGRWFRPGSRMPARRLG